jgi:hypothetical protein
MRGSHHVGNVLTCGQRAREKHAVELLSQQGIACVCRANQGGKHVNRNACFVQQAGHGQATHGCKFGRLVQNGIAHEQAWHEHIATHKPGVVPCRNIANQTQRECVEFVRTCRLGCRPFLF